MLLRIAQADAFAAAVEYVKREEHKDLFEAVERFDSYKQHPRHKGLKAGCYTDDTQMSIAVARSLIDSAITWIFRDNEDECLTHEAFAEQFFQTFKRDPRDGYSRGFQKILEKAKDSVHLRSLIVPDSTKNGAAMRSVPLGVLRDPKRVIEVAGTQAGVTHQTWAGINSSAAVALMSHFALHDRRGFNCMYDWCVQWLPAFEFFKKPWDGPVGIKDDNRSTTLGVGMCTAHAVHTLLVQEKSLMGILRKTIEWGGDTDSVASIAWGIASCRYQDELLPEFLERDLEAKGNLKYGPTFLKDLGKQLMEAYA